jgi:hypothetical protein
MIAKTSDRKAAMNPEVIQWLLEGDVSIQYQVQRDLLGREIPQLRSRIAREGWGAQYLSQRNPDGSWGRGFYQPKWTSSHYTLLDLKTLALTPDNEQIRESVDKIVREEKGPDGGINSSRTIKNSDVCMNGMFLVYACYFGVSQNSIESVVDFILSQKMEDGGFNCRRNRSGARHSSLHSTLSLLEGILEYGRNGYSYRRDELERAAGESREFILQHRLFKSHRTGEIIHRDLLRFPFPPRWKYNILRSLDYFRAANIPWDNRMTDALAVVLAKRKPDGRWLAEAAHPGKIHVQMERPRTPSRWNTLLSLRVIGKYGMAVES